MNSLRNSTPASGSSAPSAQPPWLVGTRDRSTFLRLYTQTANLVRPHLAAYYDQGEEVRVLVTGSRNFPEELAAAVEAPLRACARLRHDHIQVTDGAAAGLDTIAGRLAERLEDRGWRRVPVPANWYNGWRQMSWRTGMNPGSQRNQKMVDMGHDVCIGWPHPDPKVRSRGTYDCLTRAYDAGIPTFQVIFNQRWFIMPWTA